MTEQVAASFSLMTRRAWQEKCADTLSAKHTGRSDWQTIERFWPWLKAPEDPTNKGLPTDFAGPNSLPLDVTGIEFVAPEAQPGDVFPLAAPIFDLKTANQQPYFAGSAARAYLIKRGRETPCCSTWGSPAAIRCWRAAPSPAIPSAFLIRPVTTTSRPAM